MAKLLVSTAPVRAALAGAEACGFAADAILAAARIAPERFVREGASISLSAEERLWHALASASDARIGARAGGATPRGALGALEYAMRSAPTFGRALEVLTEHAGIWYGVPLFDLSADGDCIQLRFRSPHRPARRGSAVATEYFLTAVLTLLRQVTRTDDLVLRATVRHGAANGLSGGFRAPVADHHERDQLVFSREALALPSCEADERLHRVLEQHLALLAGDEPQRKDVVEAARRAIEDQLGERPGVAEVARTLGLSARTLQQRLQGEGITFRQLLEQVRLAQAKRYLEDSDESLAAIAEIVGYTDTSSFHRTFKRATGTTPAAFRHRGARRREPVIRRSDGRPSSPRRQGERSARSMSSSNLVAGCAPLRK